MQSVKELREDIQSRRNREKEVRARLDAFALDNFGIVGFSDIADRFIPVPANGTFDLCQARQVFTTNIENIALDLLPEWVGPALGFPVRAVPIAFTRDSYLGGNDFKKSLANIPRLSRGRNGRFVRWDRIVRKAETRDGAILGEMKTVSGELLVKYHSGLRSKADLKWDPVEIGPFFEALFRATLEGKPRAAPGFVFVKSGGTERRTSVHLLSEGADARPPADWYYLFYLMLFVDGRRGLLSTIGDEDNPEVDAWFKKSIERIEQACGFAPLIIDTPNCVKVEGFESDLLEHPDVVFSAGWREKIIFPSANDSFSVFLVKQDLEEQVIGLV